MSRQSNYSWNTVWENIAAKEHLMDSGYTAAEYLVNKTDYDVEIIGPVRPDPSCEAKRRRDSIPLIL